MAEQYEATGLFEFTDVAQGKAFTEFARSVVLPAGTITHTHFVSPDGLKGTSYWEFVSKEAADAAMLILFAYPGWCARY